MKRASPRPARAARPFASTARRLASAVHFLARAGRVFPSAARAAANGARAPRKAALACGLLGLAAFAPQEKPSAAELRAFADGLESLRAGAAVEPEFLERAGALARAGRPDAARLANFYAALSAEARRAGHAAQARYAELWQRVRAARDAGLSGPTWERVRAEVEEGLRELAQSSGRAPDPAPAAYAHALLADLAIARVATQRGLSEDERAGWLARAESNLASADLLFAEVGMQTPRIDVELARGRIELYRGALGAAERTFEACLERAEAVDRPDRLEFALTGLLDVAARFGDVARQDELLAEIARARSPAQSAALARECALRLWQDDRPEAALEFLERYPPPAQSAPEELAAYELLCGHVARRLGDFARAHEHYALLADLAAPELAELALARLALDEGRAAEARERAASAAAGELGQSGLSVERALEARTIEAQAALVLGDPAGALAALDDALASADRLDRERALELLSVGAPRGVIGEALGLTAVALAAEARALTGDALGALCLAEDYQARSLRARAPERLYALLEEGASGAAGLAPDDLRAWAAESELGFASWVVAADFTVALWLEPDGRAHGERLPLGRSAWQRAARRLREAAIAGELERAGALGREIFAALFPAELRARLEQAGLERAASGGGALPRIDLALHGPLAELAVELLVVEAESGLALEDVACLRVLPGLPAARRGARVAPSAWFFGGDPSPALFAEPPPAGPVRDGAARPIEAAARALGGESALALGGARRELEQAAASTPRATLALGADFDRAALERALASGASLHLATHLVRGARCSGRQHAPDGLLLAAGDVLCPEDLTALAAAVDTVVLAACDTAAGRFVDGDGLRGVARAFLEGGARNLVVTLWPVSDAAAESFSAHFHAALREGAAPSEATRRSRAALRASGLLPVDWAAFRFSGRD